MARYAAVDIGSNSLRLMIAEVTPGENPRIIAEAREITRLGQSVFREGEISKDAIGSVCGVLVGMARTCKEHGVVAVRAAATAAVRDASNQDEFLRNASGAIGTQVEVISGLEEARLIFRGVESVWPNTTETRLIIDVGGGSAEMIVGENGRLTNAFSKQIGALRLTEVFLKHDPPQPVELRQLDEFIAEKIAPAVARIPSSTVDRVIGTSATAGALISAVNQIPRSRRSEADRRCSTREQVEELYSELSRMDAATRRQIVGIGPRRADLIMAGTAVFRRMMEDFGLESIHYSVAGVRDGIIADLVDRGVGRERSRLTAEQRQVVEETAQRFGVSVPHARKVADMGHELFDSLEKVHKLAPEQGRLLEAAAYLHDIGHYVSDTAHHKHSEYLVTYSDLAGFTTQERKMIAQLCRYHRKAMPKSRHHGFQALSEEERNWVTKLTPLLRLADSLDQSGDQRIEQMECRLNNGNVVLYLKSEQDTDLEQWAASRAAESFHTVYSRPVALVRL